MHLPHAEIAVQTEKLSAIPIRIFVAIGLHLKFLLKFATLKHALKVSQSKHIVNGGFCAQSKAIFHNIKILPHIDDSRVSSHAVQIEKMVPKHNLIGVDVNAPVSIRCGQIPVIQLIKRRQHQI